MHEFYVADMLPNYKLFMKCLLVLTINVSYEHNKYYNFRRLILIHHAEVK